MCPKGSSASDGCATYQDCPNFTTECAYGEKWTGSACAPCAAGEVCLLRNSDSRAPTNGGTGKKYFSPANVNTEYICPAGKDCDTASVAAYPGSPLTSCNDGWYSIEGELTCSECQAPFACPHKELDQSKQIDCRNVRGYYQDANG